MQRCRAASPTAKATLVEHLEESFCLIVCILALGAFLIASTSTRR
jgi:hypothetical protein